MSRTIGHVTVTLPVGDGRDVRILRRMQLSPGVLQICVAVDESRELQVARERCRQLEQELEALRRAERAHQ